MVSRAEHLCSIKGVTNDDILKAIGRNVRACRLHAGMTQECLAEMVGIHWKTLGYIERGKYPFAVTTFARLAKYLQVSSNRLLEGVPPPDMKLLARATKALARKRQPAGKRLEK